MDYQGYVTKRCWSLHWRDHGKRQPTSAEVVLELNGYALDAPEAEAVLIFQQLAAGEIEEGKFAEWVRDSSIPNA